MTDERGTATAQDIEVTLDDTRCAQAEWTLLQNGKIRIRNITGNDQNIVMVFDKIGRCVEDKAFESDYDSSPLVQGDYSCVLIKKTSAFRSVDSIDRLTEMGLTEKEDYILHKVTIKNGIVAIIENIVVPGLDESRFDYIVKENTMLSTNKTEAVAGQYVTVRAMYEIDRKYDSSQETVRFEIPEGMFFVEKSLSVNGKSSVCTISDSDTGGSTVSVLVNAKNSTIRYYVLPTAAGTKTIYAYLSFAGKTLAGTEDAIIQSIGSVSQNVCSASINVPKKTSSTNVTVFGKAVSGCMITVYDNNTVVGTTKSNKNGSWELDFELVNPETTSNHEIFAAVNSEDDKFNFLTDHYWLYYDPVFVAVSKVTMISTFHGKEQRTVLNFRKHSTKAIS